VSALRPALALGVCAALAAATGVAAAAPKAKPVCNLIQDEKGDGGVAAGADDMDVVSADIASSAKVVTAVIRLAGDPSAVNPQAPGGKNYYLSFTAPGSDQPQFLSAEFDPITGAAYHSGYEEDVNGVGNKTSDADAVTGSVKGNVITITAPLSAFSSRVSLKPGKKLTELTAEVFALIGTGPTGGLLASADDATGTSYVTGTPSCVIPGKG
jgi:hypothetical protein